MATAILFIGWNRPNVGKEADAWAFFGGEGLGFVQGLVGKYCERVEPFALTAHGGDLNGGIILFGERAKLDELRRTDQFEAFSMKMGGLFDRYGVVPGLNWDGLQAAMERGRKAGVL